MPITSSGTPLGGAAGRWPRWYASPSASRRATTDRPGASDQRRTCSGCSGPSSCQSASNARAAGSNPCVAASRPSRAAACGVSGASAGSDHSRS